MTKGTKFREWCAKNGYTAERVANELGCSKSTVYAYFRGARSPSKNAMKRMEQIFGFDAKQMFWE